MSAARRRRAPGRRRRLRQIWKRRLVIATLVVAVSGLLVGALLLRFGQPAKHSPFRLPTAVVAITPTSEIEAGERARPQSLRRGLQETTAREPVSRR